jgi:nucleoside-diphosphate-sugar epimerase
VITGERILVTGVTGTIGAALALHLAAENDVWGIARFAGSATRAKETYTAVATPPPARAFSTREELEAAGVTVRAVDLAAGDLGDLPDDFTYVVHLAWLRADLAHLDDALRANVEGAGLVLQHCQNAKAALVMSGMGVYSANDDPWWAYSERDPVGRGATAYAPTSPACKLGLESVARFCARAFDLPIVITRLNTLTGLPGTFPAMHIDGVMSGRTMVAPSDPTPHSPIHIEDMKWMLEPLLDAASTTAFITNWCGDDVTTVQDWVRDAAAWSGRDANLAVEPVPGSPAGSMADPTRRRSITGPCRTVFTDTFRALFREVTGIPPGAAAGAGEQRGESL